MSATNGHRQLNGTKTPTKPCRPCRARCVCSVPVPRCRACARCCHGAWMAACAWCIGGIWTPMGWRSSRGCARPVWRVRVCAWTVRPTMHMRSSVPRWFGGEAFGPRRARLVEVTVAQFARAFAQRQFAPAKQCAYRTPAHRPRRLEPLRGESGQWHFAGGHARNQVAVRGEPLRGVHEQLEIHVGFAAQHLHDRHRLCLIHAEPGAHHAHPRNRQFAPCAHLTPWRSICMTCKGAGPTRSRCAWGPNGSSKPTRSARSMQTTPCAHGPSATAAGSRR